MYKLRVTDCFIASALVHGQVVAQKVDKITTRFAEPPLAAKLAASAFLRELSSQPPAQAQPHDAV